MPFCGTIFVSTHVLSPAEVEDAAQCACRNDLTDERWSVGTDSLNTNRALVSSICLLAAEWLLSSSNDTFVTSIFGKSNENEKAMRLSPRRAGFVVPGAGRFDAPTNSALKLRRKNDKIVQKLVKNRIESNSAFFASGQNFNLQGSKRQNIPVFSLKSFSKVEHEFRKPSSSR